MTCWYIKVYYSQQKKKKIPVQVGKFSASHHPRACKVWNRRNQDLKLEPHQLYVKLNETKYGGKKVEESEEEEIARLLQRLSSSNL